MILDIIIMSVVVAVIAYGAATAVNGRRQR